MIRPIAFYLPQYHPIPENDAWWGKGFTEWTNVAKGKPLFPGHYQPHLPADLGFYDLRLPEVRAAQADLARQYGVHGFCYYHYWFNGKRILQRPFEEVLASGEPDLPFCLCWANENWTRAWDGADREVLLGQNYSVEDDQAHIASLIPAFRDPRYIRVQDKPLFLVYRTELLPDPARTAEIWREAAARAGLPGLYLVRVEALRSDVDPSSIGFDAAVEFAPDWRNRGACKFDGPLHRRLARFGIFPRVYIDSYVTEYSEMVQRLLDKPMPAYKRFRCVTPGFDNSARRTSNAAIFIGSTPAKYGDWLSHAVAQTEKTFEAEEQLLFINAWNEWGEGNHLEPDQRWGHAYLEATRSALSGAGEPVAQPSPADGARGRTPTDDAIEVLRNVFFKIAGQLR